MNVGVLKEIKTKENRVAMTPAGVEAMRQHGHEVTIEKDGGIGAGFANDDYTAAGAKLASSDEIFAACEMVMHVKEPQPAGIRQAPQGPDPVHLPAPGRRRAPDQGPDQGRQREHRLRDHPDRERPPAAS